MSPYRVSAGSVARRFVRTRLQRFARKARLKAVVKMKRFMKKTWVWKALAWVLAFGVFLASQVLGRGFFYVFDVKDGLNQRINYDNTDWYAWVLFPIAGVFIGVAVVGGLLLLTQVMLLLRDAVNTWADGLQAQWEKRK